MFCVKKGPMTGRDRTHSPCWLYLRRDKYEDDASNIYLDALVVEGAYFSHDETGGEDGRGKDVEACELPALVVSAMEVC